MYQTQMNQGMGLPVPSSPINGQFWIHSGLPYQPPFVPQFQVAPELQHYVPLIVGASMHEIQQGAQRNELRSFYFNLCSANGWQNQDFLNHLVGVAQLAHLLMVSNRTLPDQAVQQAAVQMTHMLVSQQAVKYESYFARYMTQEMVQGIRQNLERFQVVSQQIQQLYSGGFSNNGYGGGPPMQRGPTFVGAPNQGIPPGYGQGGLPMGGGFPTRHAPPPATRLTNLDNLYRDDRSPPAAPVDDGFGRRFGSGRGPTKPVEEITMSPGQGVEHKSSKFPPPFSAGRAAEPVKTFEPPQPASRMPPPTHVSIDPDREWPKVYDPTRPYDSMVLETGEEIRPAHTSGWTVTFDIENPFPLVYRRGTQMLFHVRNPDGTVNELILERNEAMSYLDHELDPKLRAAAKAAAVNPNVITALNWKGAVMIQQVDGKPFTQNIEQVEEGNYEVEVEAFPITDDTVIQAHSLAEASVKLTMAYSSAGMTRDDSKVTEYYVDLLTPIPGDNTDARRAIAALRNATSLTNMVEKLTEFRDKIPEALFNLVDQRLTNRLNLALDKSLGLVGWSIDSFYNDLLELLQAIRETYNESLIDTLQDNYREIVAPAVEVLLNNGLERYLESIGAQNTSPGKSGMLVFRDRVSILNVPWSYDDMALEIRDGGVVTQSKLPEAYAVFEAVFHRTRSSHIPFARHYLVTKDQKRIEFRRGYLGRNAIVVYPPAA